MEKRKSKRVKTHQLAKICGNTGVVNNVSSRGLLVSTPIMPKNRKIDVTFEADGEQVTVWGTVQWLRRKTTLQRLNFLGVLLKDAPPSYYLFVSEHSQE